MCAIFGFLDYMGKVDIKVLKKLIRALSVEAEIRGTDATGISYVRDNKLVTFKKGKAAHKVKGLMQEYSVATLDDIGCFVILESTEIAMFSTSEMEFVEVLKIGEESYLHGVKILSDSYGEDTYMPIEVKVC